MQVNGISVRDKGRQVRLTWSDGLEQDIAASELRIRGRDASSVRRAIDGGGPTDIPADLAITDVNLVGSYAVNIRFSDGFDRAIYPWSYLRQLAGSKAAPGAAIS